MNTNTKKNIKKVASVIGIVLLSSSIIAPATADNTGGPGGGGAIGSYKGWAEWRTVNSSNGTTAWQKFVSNSELPESKVESEVRQRTGNLELCKKSNRIWYVQSLGVPYNGVVYKGWSYDFSGYTHGDYWNYARANDSSIENPVAVLNSTKPNLAQVDSFKNWDRLNNGNRIDVRPGYVIICSGSFDNYEPKKRTVTKEVSRESKESDKTQYTEPINYTTEVTPQIVDNKGQDPIGNNNLHHQKETVPTNFGEVYKKYSDVKNAKVEDIKREVEEAIQKDKDLNHGTLDLDEQNKAGMAEGGVLNFSERTQYASISASKRTTTVKTKTCTYISEYDYNLGRYGEEKESCVDNPDTVVVSYTSATNGGTQKQTGFWQMISVHCNANDFNNLINNVEGVRVLDSGDATKGLSAVAVTKNYQQQPNNLDFGDTSNIDSNIVNNIYDNSGDKTARAERSSQGALNIIIDKNDVNLAGVENSGKISRALSGTLGFYDKECPFECTPSNNVANGASSLNGAINNLSNTPQAKNDSKVGGGATSDDNTAEKFEFFRDNNNNKLQVDVWYPKSNNVVKYKGEAPLTTTISRWLEGTPAVNSTNGGQFSFNSVKGNKLFTGTEKVKTQKNWSIDTFSNSTSTVIPGLHNEFNAKSTWASETDKPQKLNFKWEYAPNVTTNIQTNNVGFGKNSTVNYGTSSTVGTPIQGKCYAYFGNMEASDTSSIFHENTGSGTSNELDGHLLETTGNSNAQLVINFVRAVSR